MNVYRSKLNKNKIHTEGISIDQTSPINIWTKTSYAHETVQLSATITPPDATYQNVIWSSSNPSVATVSDTGLVERIGHGTAVITASTEDGNSDALTVNVNYGVDIATANPNRLNLNTGDSASISLYMIPEYATGYDVSWSCSDSTVAALVPSGNTCSITTLKSGECNIVCTITEPHFNDNELVLTIPVEVISGRAKELSIVATPDGDFETTSGKYFWVRTVPTDAINRFNWSYNIAAYGCTYRDVWVERTDRQNFVAANFFKTYPSGTDATVTVTITLDGLSASYSFKITGAPYQA